VVVDGCGDWPTFVGGGPSAFLTATPTATVSASRTPTTTRTAMASPSRTRTPTPTATGTPNFRVRLDTVVGGLSSPVFVTHAGDGTDDLYVVQQTGQILRRAASSGMLSTFLDLAGLLPNPPGSEQGLLGLAFHPRYTTNGYLYVHYTATNGDTVVARYTAAADRASALPGSASIVIGIPHPRFTNHNAGMLAFGPDGYLYVGTGDGGGGGDPDGNAQNPESLRGKMLRLDVNTVPYDIPTTNPYFGQTRPRPEIWASGLRNPWRYSFDRGSGDLYVADVGQNLYEEVNRQPAGAAGGQNYGWPIMEGLHCFQPANCDPTGLQLPIAEYPHSLGCSVTGGYVYRGAAYQIMAGMYLFGDYCSGRIWTLQNVGGVWQRVERLDSNVSISSFGEDRFGELYVTGIGSSTGTLYRVVVVSP
jgi:glucose/arabinose dehydrogenase